MACDPFDCLPMMAENLGDKIYRAASHQSIWLNLIPRGMYPLNTGTNQVVYGIGKSEPTTNVGAGWTQIDISVGTTQGAITTLANLCADSWTEVTPGKLSLSYMPERRQLEGPEICREDFLFSHNPSGFMTGYFQELTRRAQREWEYNYEYHHRRLSAKAIATTDFENAIYSQEALTGMTCPDCELTQEMLEFLAQRLIEDGATNPDSNGFIALGDAGPLFSLYIGMNQSQRILRQNSELRQDYRYGNPSELIKRVGATRVIGSFRHVINTLPARYTCLNGTFTRVMPFAAAGQETCDYQDINSAWRTAPYEGADILSPELFTSEIVNSRSSAGPYVFDPKTYMGTWQWITGAYKWDPDTTCSDPLKDRGRHFAEFYHAPRPNPLARYRYGYHIIFKRCVGNLMECTTCSS